MKLLSFKFVMCLSCKRLLFFLICRNTVFGIEPSARIIHATLLFGLQNIVSKENDVLMFLLYLKKDDIVFSIFSKVNVFLGFLKGSKELADSDI